MNRRLPKPPTPSSSPNFGLIAWLEKTQVRLPLKGVECRFHVCADLLSVEIDQIFHQNARTAVNCLYTFPLPAGAAVHRCELHVNGRIIRAKVEEQERARAIAREQQAAGRRTALVEVERENLFTLSLGNLQPGDVVVVRFAYVETLTRLAEWTSLRIPFCPGVRYIPGEPLLRSLRGKGAADDTDQVPDASRISPPRIEALHPDAARLSVEGLIEDPTGLISDISSASHPVIVKDGCRQFDVRLAFGDTVPDCDFALRWTEKEAEQIGSAAWATRAGDETYALVLLQAPRLDTPAEGLPQDFYFLVDRSGSMEGLKWEKAVESFRAFLKQLGPDDRAWVTFFNNAHRDFAEKPLRAREFLEDANLCSIEKLGANGGTELLPALQHVLAKMRRHSTDRDAALILITDGQVGNEREILDSLREHPNVRLHAFGIDAAVNDALLSRLAAQQRGSSCLLQPTDDIVGAVSRLGARLRRPVVTSLKAGEGWELPGEIGPDLYSSERVSLSLRTSSAHPADVVLLGRLPDGREQTFRLPLVESHEPAVRLFWARRQIAHCLERGEQSAAVALARENNLLCPGAAFIAWDEAERVMVGQEEIYQPSVEVKFLEMTFGNIKCAGESPGAEGRIGWRSVLGGEPPGFEKLYENLVGDVSGLVGRAAPAFLGPPYCKDCAGTLVDQARERQLLAILAKPLESGKRASRLEVGRRLVEWHRRFCVSFAFPPEVLDPDLVELFVIWVAQGDAAQRMTALEKFMEQLEWEAPDPESGLRILAKWVTAEMTGEDQAFHDRYQAAVMNMTARLSEIRRREMDTGIKILVR